MSSSKSPLSYKDAGVDIDAGNRLVSNIKSITERTRRPEVLGGLGGFGALMEIPGGYQKPVLVTATDGVGTKLKLAHAMNKHDTIGIDLVAMCANDLIVGGAEPLQFLDYYATGHLNVNTATEVIKGIGRGCEIAGCALVGGETAEMPGMYQGEEYDLAGFCVGVVEKTRIIDGSRVKPGDKLVALASSGPHSNGYSLIRKIVERSGANYSDDLFGRTLGEALLEPTRIYVKPILGMLSQVDVHALCHITGGGFYENLPRVMPPHTHAMIDQRSWRWPDVFEWLQQEGNISPTEMYRTFNCGVGMIGIIEAEDAERAIEYLRQRGEQAWLLGEIVGSDEEEPGVTIHHMDAR